MVDVFSDSLDAIFFESIDFVKCSDCMFSIDIHHTIFRFSIDLLNTFVVEFTVSVKCLDCMFSIDIHHTIST